MRYLAIDYGTKRIGLAMCDAEETIISPFKVIESGKVSIEKIIEIINKENVQAVVVGLPLNMNNSHGSQAKLTCKFADKLKKQIELPIYLQDERLSSFEAGGKIADAEFTRKKKKKRLDAIAAAEILQMFFDSKI